MFRPPCVSVVVVLQHLTDWRLNLSISLLLDPRLWPQVDGQIHRLFYQTIENIINNQALHSRVLHFTKPDGEASVLTRPANSVCGGGTW